MAVPTQERRSSTADILSIMARLASSGGQMPNLPMVPFPQQGFGGSISGRASGGGRSSGGGTAGSRGLTEVLRDADGKPIQRDWGNLSPTEAKSLAIRLDGWVDAGYTPDQLQSLVSPWNLSLKDSPYGQKKQKTRKDYQEDLTTTGSIYKSLDGMPEGKAMAQAMEIPGMEGYIHRDPGRVMPASGGGVLADIGIVNALREYAKKDPAGAEAIRKKWNAPKYTLQKEPLTTAQQNQIRSDVVEGFENSSPDEQDRRIKEFARNGGNPAYLLQKSTPLLEMIPDEAFKSAMIKGNGWSTRGQAAFDAAREQLEEEAQEIADAWYYQQAALVPKDERTAEWVKNTNKGVALQKRAALRSITGPRIRATMQTRFGKQLDTMRSIMTPRVGPSVGPQGQRFTPDGHRLSSSREGLQQPIPQQPLSAPEVMADPESGQVPERETKPFLQGLFAPAADAGIQPGGRVKTSPVETMIEDFTRYREQQVQVHQQGSMGFDDPKDAQDLKNQTKVIYGIAQEAEERRGQKNSVPQNFIPAIQKEIEKYRRMESQMTKQLTIEEQATTEMVSQADGTKIFRAPDGKWVSLMPPKSNIQLETQRMQQDGQMGQERLEFEREKHEFERQRMASDSQHRDQDRDQADDIGRRKELMEFSNQPGEVPQIPVDSGDKSAEPAINTTIDPNVLPLLPQPLQGEALPGEGLLPVGPDGQPIRPGETKIQKAIREMKRGGLSEADVFGDDFVDDALVVDPDGTPLTKFDIKKLPAAVKKSREGKAILELRAKYKGESKTDLAMRYSADLVLETMVNETTDDPAALSEALKLLKLAGLRFEE